MRFTEFALSLNVSDVTASAGWLREHFGFEEQLAAEGFVALRHPETGTNLIYLAVGLPSFTPASAAGHADGLLVAFTVDDLDAQHERLVAAGATVVTPPETEPWGERYSQYADPNGVIYQLVQWVEQPPAEAVSTGP